ncbi:MAG: hypothetical protein QNJ97_07295 [Myxococcota bacterium]|nr:hypothetical protein [Myxococcota bacterium]
MKHLLIIGLSLIGLLTTTNAQSAGRKGKPAPGVGLDPNQLVLHELVLPVDYQPDTELQLKDLHFQFHGFLRVPFRLGIGTGQDLESNGDSDTKLHVPPQIPDSSYMNWNFTNNMGGPWTELRFIYGNETVAANVSIASYNITDGGYRDLTAQLGINQSFVSLNFPKLFGSLGGIVVNVGVFSNRYGAAGQYSADKYDTYLFGATHTAGENLRAFFDISDTLTLHVEQGFGGKLMMAPFDGPEASYLPYGGPEQQGTTLLNHAHLGISYKDKLTVAGHFLMSFNTDATQIAETDPEEKDGRLINVGVDVKFIEFFFGQGYLGYSHIMTKDLARLSGAVELLHSREGWSLIDNYFHPADINLDPPAGNGSIDSILFQYIFSLAKFLWHPREFWGQARDLRFSLFSMYNHIKCDDENWNGVTDKLKYGGDVVYTPVSWLGIGARYDLVQPDLDNANKSFHVTSGMLFFHSNFISHEQLVLQYSHYFNGKEVSASWPYDDAPYGPATYDGEPPLRPDDGVIKISAIMWW